MRVLEVVGKTLVSDLVLERLGLVEDRALNMEKPRRGDWRYKTDASPGLGKHQDIELSWLRQRSAFSICAAAPLLQVRP